ncbi:trypsin-like serine protease [Erythrobacter donghaensis]|jgi:TPR repeat protein|uniref:trypsin-like serine protease n=2 Tax=Erythrobacter donghaensis TaxID=267135 RepID=UPI00093CEE03|nr:trypsin-like serine protease [Erythrobacter donghaensis]
MVRGKVMIRLAIMVALVLGTPRLAAQDEGEGGPSAAPEAEAPYPADPGREGRARFIDRFGPEIAEADYDPPAAEAACKAGVVEACTDLGVAYRWGDVVDRNRPVAEVILRKACAAADARACAVLGDLLGTHGDPARRAEQPALFARACTLGLAAACADGSGATPAAIERRYRAACDSGGIPACRALGERLIGETRSARDRGEGIALLGGLCRNGDTQACSRAQAYWRGLDAPGSAQAANAFAALGCEAGDAAACTLLGNAALGQGPVARAAALLRFEQACARDATRCTGLEHVRDEPALAARCTAGDQAACLGHGLILARTDTALRDAARGAALVIAACEAGTPGACHPAGELLLYGDAEPDRGAATGRAEALLTRGCDAAEQAACELLADQLAVGNWLARDIDRATTLYLALCDAGRDAACQWLVNANHPAAPLPPAEGIMPPLLTEADVAEAARREAEERTRAARRRAIRQCAPNEVVWEGVTYRDKTCILVLRAIGGFTVNRVDLAPFQALLWRPPVLGRQRVGFRTACGGSVVATGWIITAAHCTYDQGYRIEEQDYRIRLGVIRPEAPEGNSYPILRVIRHPNFSPRTYQFDIALVQYDPARGTRGDFAFGARRIAVDTRSLTQRPVRPRAPVFAFGWGRQSLDDPTPARILQGVKLELEDAAACTKRTAYRDWRKDSVLCAMGAQREQACTGDSGGPLVTYEDQRGVPTLIGVVSSGEKCSTTGVPSRYIRIGHPAVQDWLAQNLPGFRRPAASANSAR